MRIATRSCLLLVFCQKTSTWSESHLQRPGSGPDSHCLLPAWPALRHRRPLAYRACNLRAAGGPGSGETLVRAFRQVGRGCKPEQSRIQKLLRKLLARIQNSETRLPKLGRIQKLLGRIQETSWIPKLRLGNYVHEFRNNCVRFRNYCGGRIRKLFGRIQKLPRTDSETAPPDSATVTDGFGEYSQKIFPTDSESTPTD